MRLVLLHSPLVGPGTWRLLAPALRARGHEVVVPDYSGVMRGQGPYYSAIIESIRVAFCSSTSEATAFIAHSGAGALIPSVAAGNFAIFADAPLPYPGRSWFDTVPEVLKQRLVAIARDGRVPPWHRWWPEGAMENLFGDKQLYERFAADLRELPLAFFSEAAPPAGDLSMQRCAYLQLSEAYAADADVAEARGWLIRRLQLDHLAMLTEPDLASETLDDIARNLANQI